MVYSTRRIVVCLTVCHFVLVFFSLFSIAITSLGECFSYVCSICACLDLSVSSSSWCLGRAAVCDCGTLWTFFLPFSEKHKNKMTQGKTCNKSPRRINHKATKSKTNTGTTALERSVE